MTAAACAVVLIAALSGGSWASSPAPDLSGPVVVFGAGSNDADGPGPPPSDQGNGGHDGVGADEAPRPSPQPAARRN